LAKKFQKHGLKHLGEPFPSGVLEGILNVTGRDEDIRKLRRGEESKIRLSGPRKEASGRGDALY